MHVELTTPRGQLVFKWIEKSSYWANGSNSTSEKTCVISGRGCTMLEFDYAHEIAADAMVEIHAPGSAPEK